MKTCKSCHQSLPYNKFKRAKTGKDGYTNICSKCIDLRNRKQKPERFFRTVYSNQCSSSKMRGHPQPSYSFEQFILWLDSQPNLIKLWDDWVQSNYDEKLTPSVDRIDDSLPYDLNNIQVVSWIENHRKEQDLRKNGQKFSGHKPVTAYTLDGFFSKNFISIAEAARHVEGDITSIKRVADGKPIQHTNGSTYTPKHHKGFIWRWT